MTFNIHKWTFELTATHAYFKVFGWEGLVDFTGQVGHSFSRT